jgi:hypothetical protein
MAYVYLIRHAKEQRFKIGKSVHPLNRSSAFSEPLDLSNSLQIYLGKRAVNFEKGLHALFDKYRLPSVSDSDGATEWFSDECWQPCLAFLDQYRELIGAVVGPIPPQATTVLLSREEKAARRLLNKEIKRQSVRQKNLESIERWEQFFAWLNTKDYAVERGIEGLSVVCRIQGCVGEVERDFVFDQLLSVRFLTDDVYFGSWNIQAEGSWIKDGRDFTVEFRRFPLKAREQMRFDLDSELIARFDAMDSWIKQHIGELERD